MPLAQVNTDFAADGTISASKVLYLHADHLNMPRLDMPRLATDSGQTLQWSWNSDAYGVGAPNEDVDGDGDEDGDGEWASLGLGAGCMAYAGIVKIGAAAAADGTGAMAFRNGLKRVMRGPLAGSDYRIKSYEDLLSKYGSDEAIQPAAVRTHPAVSAAGADMAIGGAVGAGTCGCP
ncbi:hypothetical protein SFA35_16800 [Pseudomonas sp. HR96]|uniref:hypothetical protein n=1 Tax=Pseudomonas sp. HR96 TaxID=1027966 RepID=UPI002A766615|nr:hypothetical protein [Pseudomonas sp. HR96]WPO98298.1 hypothetical protein SFA35_16800 [Pseudomonas sp. HR96]